MEGGIEHGAWSIEQISDFGLQNADLRQAKPAKLAKQAKLIVRFFCGSGFPRPEALQGKSQSCSLNDFYDLPLTANE
jgi:hypothetical protein